MRAVQLLTTSDRTGLVDNVFTAARRGLVSYDVALQLAQYLAREDQQTPWKAFVVNVNYIDDMMHQSAYYAHWQVVTLSRQRVRYRTVKG